MPSSLESIIHHVALNPQLPGQREGRIDKIEQELTARLVKATRTLCDVSDGTLHRQWDSTRCMLQTAKELNVGGKISKASLILELGRLSRDDVLILHVSEQNAALLIRRHQQ